MVTYTLHPELVKYEKGLNWVKTSILYKFRDFMYDKDMLEGGEPLQLIDAVVKAIENLLNAMYHFKWRSHHAQEHQAKTSPNL